MSEKPKTLFIYIGLRQERNAPLSQAVDFVDAIISSCFKGVEDFIQINKQAFFIDEDACYPQLLKLFSKIKLEGLEAVVCEVGPSTMTIHANHPNLKEWLSKRGVKIRAIQCSAPSEQNKP